MRFILLLVLILVAVVPSFGVEDPELFSAYQNRLRERRVYALRVRAEINSMRPPARGWLAIQVPINVISPIVPLDRGVVSQSPIYRSFRQPVVRCRSWEY